MAHPLPLPTCERCIDGSYFSGRGNQADKVCMMGSKGTATKAGRAITVCAIVTLLVLPVAPASPDHGEVYTFIGENSDGEFVTFEWQFDEHTDHLTNCFATAPYGATCSNEGHDGTAAIHGFFVLVHMFDGVLTSTISDGERYRTLACHVSDGQFVLCESAGDWPEAVPWRQDCVTAGKGFWVCSSQHPEPEA